MSEKVLLVDDDPNVLNGFRRQLRKQYDIQCAEGGPQALAELEQTGPYALVVSDMQMPDINGLELFRQMRNEYPDTVRIMLTGNADQGTAVNAVNQGSIFRFLNKPCETEELSSAIDAGLEQYRLVIAERELLSETLNGCIDLLNDVLGLTSPTAFGRANRLRSIIQPLTEQVPESARWQLEASAGLSQIGWVTIPQNVIEKRSRGQELKDSEEAMIRAIPGLSAQFVRTIPRLEPVSQIIELQEKLARGESDLDAEEDLLRCATLLDLVLAYDELSGRLEEDKALEAIQEMERFSGELELLEQLRHAAKFHSHRITLPLDKLRATMILEQDIVTVEGTLVVRSGHTITDSLLVRLRNYHSNQGIAQPIHVRVR